MTDLLIVDGHNVIHRLGRYRSLAAKGMEMAVDRLVMDLVNLAGSIEAETVLVLDGQGAGSTAKQNDLTIIYSPGGRSADQIIERLVFDQESGRQVTVCTSDFAQQKVIGRRGIRRMPPRELETLLDELKTDVKPPAAADRQAIEDRLPEKIYRRLDRIRRPEN